MAVDNRPFKSKEQDGQGNEVIIRDQQLVEQGTATTMASGACFETRDVDDRPVKIPRDNMMNIVLECIGIILNDSSRNLGTNVQKALGLQGNTVGHSTVADFASVLGANFDVKYFKGVNIPVNSENGLEMTSSLSFVCICMGYHTCSIIAGTMYNGTAYVDLVKAITLSGTPDYTATAAIDSWPDTGTFKFRISNGKWYFKPALSGSQNYFDVWVFCGRG